MYVMTRALVPLADGVEEMEAVIIIDTLRRAGWEVVSAGMQPGVVVASRGVRLSPDEDWSRIDPNTFDLLVLPGGGEGTKKLSSDERILEAIRGFVLSGKTVGAICAGPLVLQSAGVLNGRRATCHPAVSAKLSVTARDRDRVVTDGGIVTSQGPGTAFEFALALIGLVDGSARADEVADGLVL